MYLVQGIHPTTPGVRAILCTTPERAAAEAKKLVVEIGNDIVNGMSDPELSEGWTIAKMNDWDGALASLKNDVVADTDDYPEFDVWIDEMEPVDAADDIDPTVAEVAALQPSDEEIIAAATRDAIEHGVLTGLKGIPILKPGEEIELISVEGGKSYSLGAGVLGLNLKAVRWYNEDGDHVGTSMVTGETVVVPAGVTHARPLLAMNTIGAAALNKLDSVANALALSEPLPTALAMIDHIINMGGEAGNYGRYAKRALAEIVSAGTELHSSLGEALETHIYDTTNGDEIKPDCGYVKAMEGWAEAMAGSPMSYALPAAPLPWRCVHTTKSIALVGANDCGTGIAIANPTDEQIRNVLALLAAVNAQPVVEMQAEIAVILQGGVVQNVCGRNSVGVTVHVVDYDTDGADPHTLHPIRQDSGKDAMAVLSRYSPEFIDRTDGPDFWLSLGQGEG